jgi:type III secretory pathway component EscS
VPIDQLVANAQQALVLAMAMAIPVLAVAAVVGLIMAVLQAATQVQDATIAHLPRLLAVTIALAAFGPWMGRQIATFAIQVFSGG